MGITGEVVFRTSDRHNACVAYFWIDVQTGLTGFSPFVARLDISKTEVGPSTQSFRQ